MIHNVDFMNIVIISEDFFSHDIVEIFSSDFFSIWTGSLQHFLEFFNTHGFSEFLGYLFDVLNVDALTDIIIKEIEYLVDSFSSFLITYWWI